jgi:hypothetical protein
MSGYFEAAFQRLGYLMSLPERTMRSLAAVAGGTTSLLTETLFPDTLRGTTMYKFFIGDAQRFVIERVAQIQSEGRPAGAAAGAGTEAPEFDQRKMVSGALETAGLLAMHLSPLWVFAVAGDAAAGSNEFLQRLVTRLKRNNVLPADAEIGGLQDLLVSIQDASRRGAAAADTPALSREEIRKLASDMTENYRQMFSKVKDLLPRLETLWSRMEALASREHVSLERLGGRGRTGGHRRVRHQPHEAVPAVGQRPLQPGEEDVDGVDAGDSGEEGDLRARGRAETVGLILTHPFQHVFSAF